MTERVSLSKKRFAQLRKSACCKGSYLSHKPVPNRWLVVGSEWVSDTYCISWLLITAQHIHLLALKSETNVAIGKARAASAQSFALWQQATIEFTRHDHSIIACSRHIYILLFFAHIPFVVNHTINATPTERSQYWPKNSTWTEISTSSCNKSLACCSIANRSIR